MTRRIELREHQTTECVQLSLDELDTLARFLPSVTRQPSRGMPGHFDLRPGSTVGSLQLPGFEIHIRPKLPIGQLLFLLSYAADQISWAEDEARGSSQDDLLEAAAAAFVFRTQRLTRMGILQGYVTREEALTVMRGRLRVDDQIRHRYGRFPPVDARFDDYSTDILANQLLRLAARRLMRFRLRSSATRRGLRAIDMALAEVGLPHIDLRRPPKLAYTRLNQHYRPAVELARRILRSTAFDQGDRAVSIPGFLVNMNDAFEDFVAVALREALGATERSFRQGWPGPRLNLDQERRIRLVPDLSWWRGPDCVFVGDVKYKRLAGAEVKHADVYQLLAYTIATGLSQGMLIYAAGESRPRTHHIPMAGKRLEIVSLDVSGSPRQVLDEIGRVADRVRDMSKAASSTASSPRALRQA